jgi:hypothetical protein
LGEDDSSSSNAFPTFTDCHSAIMDGQGHGFGQEEIDLYGTAPRNHPYDGYAS